MWNCADFFNSIFDNSVTQNIGEIEIHWPTRTIWVGTGENNSSRSSYSGVGILKSTNNGDTWENKGLSDSHHIGKILVNPGDPNHVIVGVTGHLYSENNIIYPLKKPILKPEVKEKKISKNIIKPLKKPIIKKIYKCFAFFRSMENSA